MVRKIRAKRVLQLRAEGLSGRAIAVSQGMSGKSITAVLEAADVAGVVWDDIAGSMDREVYARLFPGRGEHQSMFTQPYWDHVDRGDGPGRSDAEDAAWRVRRFMRR